MVLLAWAKRLHPFLYIVLKMKTRETPGPAQATELTSQPSLPKPVVGKGINYSHVPSIVGSLCVITELLGVAVHLPSSVPLGPLYSRPPLILV